MDCIILNRKVQLIKQKYKCILTLKGCRQMIDPFSDAVFASKSDNHHPQIKIQPLSIAPNIDNNKLPKIEKEKQKANVKIMNKFIKSTTKLPNLKIQTLQPVQNDPKTIKEVDESMTSAVQKLKSRQKSQGDDFTSQIERKLKIVLENQQGGQNYVEGSDSDEQFEAKIRKHRQLIKKEKQKRQVESQVVNQKNNAPNFLISPLDIKRESVNTSHHRFQNEIAQRLKNKQDLIYDKRVKDYRDESIGNRFLAKKKQTAQKQQQIFKTKQEHEQGLAFSNYQSSKTKLPESRMASKKVSSKVIHSQIKDEELFENLHNILLDPVRKTQNEVVKGRPKRTKQCLKEQLKIIEKKLADQRKEDLDMLSRLEMTRKRQSCRPEIQIEEVTVVNSLKDEYQSWRKIDATSFWLEEKRTNFDEEVSRVNKYFEKSERSLQKHIENQKRLADLYLLSRKSEQEATKIKV